MGKGFPVERIYLAETEREKGKFALYHTVESRSADCTPLSFLFDLTPEYVSGYLGGVVHARGRYPREILNMIPSKEDAPRNLCGVLLKSLELKDFARIIEGANLQTAFRKDSIRIHPFGLESAFR